MKEMILVPKDSLKSVLSAAYANYVDCKVYSQGMGANDAETLLRIAKRIDDAIADCYINQLTPEVVDDIVRKTSDGSYAFGGKSNRGDVTDIIESMGIILSSSRTLTY